MFAVSFGTNSVADRSVCDKSAVPGAKGICSHSINITSWQGQHGSKLTYKMHTLVLKCIREKTE